MTTKKENDLIEVFAGSSIEAGIVQSMLQDAEINVFVKNENMGTIAPWQVSAGGVGAVTIVVGSKDYDEAKLIIEKFEERK